MIYLLFEFATAYAQTYFIKVRNRLEQDNAEAFKEFTTILGHFHSSVNSHQELYKKIVTILGPYPDLLDEFVLFLTPEVAADCGVQFQHFLYVRMREFFHKLKVILIVITIKNSDMTMGNNVVLSCRFTSTIIPHS